MIKESISRISLGSAQFGLDYGIANRGGRISQEEIFDILHYAQTIGIATIDTAYDYGTSESVIGGYIGKTPGTFQVISKTPHMRGRQPSEVGECLKASLQRLKIDKLKGYLIHKFGDYLVHNELWPCMQGLKSSGAVEKIGFSLYHPEELDTLFERKISFDLVQFPYSVFDRRFAHQFERLTERNIEIHVRSVFLQGLVFLGPDCVPTYLDQTRDAIVRLRDLAERRRVSIASVCLNFVLLNQHIDKIIIGVDNLLQLKKNVESLDDQSTVKDIYAELEDLIIEEERLVLPTQWGSS